MKLDHKQIDRLLFILIDSGVTYMPLNKFLEESEKTIGFSRELTSAYLLLLESYDVMKSVMQGQIMSVRVGGNYYEALEQGFEKWLNDSRDLKKNERELIVASKKSAISSIIVMWTTLGVSVITALLFSFDIFNDLKPAKISAPMLEKQLETLLTKEKKQESMQNRILDSLKLELHKISMRSDSTSP